MANESMFGILGQATELRQRILFTLGALIVYRLGTYIPVPGINAVALSEIVIMQTAVFWECLICSLVAL